MQFQLPRRHRKSFEGSTNKKLNTKFNKTESLEIFETIKKEYNNSPVTFGSSSGKKEALLELLIITASQIAEEYKDSQLSFNSLCLGYVQTKMLEKAFPGYQAEVSPFEMAEYIYNFSVNGKKLFNGKVIPISKSNP